MPLVDVIVPTHNRRRLLERALASVLGQTLTDFTVTVVADQCDDDTLDWLATVNDPRLSMVETPGVVPCTARNIGAATGTAANVAFLDDDNTWTSRFLDVMLEQLTDRTVLAYSGQQCYLATGPVGNLRIIARRIRSVPFNPVALLAENYIDTSSIVMSRRVFDAAGGFDPAMVGLEDWDLYGRIAVSHPFEVVHVDEILGHYWYYTTNTMETVQNTTWGDEHIMSSFSLGRVPDIAARVQSRLRDASISTRTERDATVPWADTSTNAKRRVVASGWRKCATPG